MKSPWQSAAVASFRRRHDAHRATFETLEARQVLSAAGLAAAATDFADPLAAPLVDVPVAISVYRNGELVETIAPAEDTDVERGLSLRTALANAQDFDTLVLGAFTYDMGSTEHIEFPARVTVVGAGQELTRITSSCSQNEDGAATFTLNNLTELRDLWLEGSLNSGEYQPLVGMQGGPIEDVETTLRRVKITGDSDGLFVWTGSQFSYTIIGYDLDINTRYDAVALLGGGYYPQTIKLYNSTLTVSQPSGIPAHISNAVNLHSGFLGLYNCTVNVTGDDNSVQTAGVWAYGAGAAEVVNSAFNVSAPSGFAYDLFLQDGGAVTVMGGSGSGEDGAFTSNNGTETYEPAPTSSVAGRYLFYNYSRFDGYSLTPSVADNQALAVDKSAWLPGSGAATFDNVSSYSRGINGVMIDLAGPHGAIGVDDFQFRVGTSQDLDSWTAGPKLASVAVWGGEGVDNSDRVELIWPNGTIVNQWLEITVLANEKTGLSAPEVFYFGSRLGDTGIGATAVSVVTNGSDLIAIRNNTGAGQAIDSVFDFNRDGATNLSDELVVRNNYGSLRRLNAGFSALDVDALAALDAESYEIEPFDLAEVAMGVAQQQTGWVLAPDSIGELRLAVALEHLTKEPKLPALQNRPLVDQLELPVACEIKARVVRAVRETQVDDPHLPRPRR